MASLTTLDLWRMHSFYSIYLLCTMMQWYQDTIQIYLNIHHCYKTLFKPNCFFSQSTYSITLGTVFEWPELYLWTSFFMGVHSPVLY